MAYHTMPFAVWPEHTVDRSSVLTESWRRHSEARPLGQGGEFPRLASIQLSMNTEEIYPSLIEILTFFRFSRNFLHHFTKNSQSPSYKVLGTFFEFHKKILQKNSRNIYPITYRDGNFFWFSQKNLKKYLSPHLYTFRKISILSQKSFKKLSENFLPHFFIGNFFEFEPKIFVNF